MVSYETLNVGCSIYTSYNQSTLNIGTGGILIESNRYFTHHILKIVDGTDAMWLDLIFGNVMNVNIQLFPS